MRRRDVLAAALLIACVVLLYRKVTRLWWVFDDSNLLRTLYDTRPLDAWTSGAVWPQQLFTPLMFSAFEAQHALFGLETRWWYVAHLFVACCAFVALYFACRRFLDVVPSFVAIVLFVLGTPICSLITQLSTVHYFIALFFGALSVIANAPHPVPLPVERGEGGPEQSEGPGEGSISAIFYFIALLAKEIAAPLPLLLFFLPGSRRRTVGFHVVALIVYLIWRRAVIGTVIGAYSWATEIGEWPRVALSLPGAILRALAGVNVWAGAVLLALLLIVIVVRGRRALPLLVVAVVVSLAPILPVAKNLHRRYAVVPWLAASVAFAALAPRRWVLALALVPAIVVNRQEWTYEYRDRLRMSDEARFFMDVPSNGLLRNPRTPPPVLRDLYWLKTDVLRKEAGAGAFYDDFYLCARDVSGKRVWQYDAPRRVMVEITHDIPRITSRHCSSLDMTRPLFAHFRLAKGAMFWELGPYERGTYRVLLGDGVEAWELPRRDALHLRGVERLELRLRYDSPERWSTYSPLLALDFSNKELYWKRP